MRYAIGLGFSSECNMNCPFCYSKAKRQEGNNSDLELWFRFFRKNASFISNINYGTGENTTSDTWYQLAHFIREYYPDIRQALTTNGYLSAVVRKDSRKRDIIAQTIDEIDVSLDFSDPEIHNYYRGNPSAYHWALDTLTFCNENGILPTIVTLGIDDTLSLSNCEKLFEIAEKFNAKIRINLYRPVNKKSNIRPASLDAIIKFMDWVHCKHRIVSISDPLFSSLLCQKDISPDPSGSQSLRITQDGNIYPSTYLLYSEFLLGNIRDFNIKTDVQNNPSIQKLLDAPLPETCKHCKFASECKGGVLDRRYIWNGTLAERDPYCFVDKPELMRNYAQHKESFTSVHDGYLPTLFFEP